MILSVSRATSPSAVEDKADKAVESASSVDDYDTEEDEGSVTIAHV
jgi:hypothetical protein